MFPIVVAADAAVAAVVLVRVAVLTVVSVNDNSVLLLLLSQVSPYSSWHKIYKSAFFVTLLFYCNCPLLLLLQYLVAVNFVVVLCLVANYVLRAS